jgi:outer membrane immunogenic protein
MLSIALSAARTVEAADLAPRPVPPAVAFNWSGFHVGGTVGWAWSAFDPHSSTVIDGYLPAAEDVAAVNATGAQSLKAKAWSGGIGAGFNWQTGQVVVGLEADIQALRLAGTVTNSGGYPTGGNVTYAFTTSANTNWLLTVRPRLGWAIDNWLVFATGGLAVSDVSATFLWGDSSPAPGVFESATFTTVKAGYVVGGGVETAIGPRWSIKAEYLYVRMSTASTSASPVQWPGQVFTHNTELRASVARAGASFRF